MGLIVALVPTIFGALLIFFLLTVRGGAPRFFYIAAALPLLVGLKMLTSHFYELPLSLTLGAVVLILALSVGASLVWPEKPEKSGDRAIG